jgi:prepilin-type N-terminal cleavage/methylation domain-containing protein
MNKGFTLVELIISISIFVFMTTLLIIKFGNFNQSVLMTNLIYDMALVVRQAQTFGVSVINADISGSSGLFQYPYGVSFGTGALTSDPTSVGLTRMVLFADSNPLVLPDGVYTLGSDLVISKYNITRGVKLTNICVGTGPTDCTNLNNPATLNISFKRPEPRAIICGIGNGGSNPCPTSPALYAEVTITGTDGSIRKLIVSRNGQISISQ